MRRRREIVDFEEELKRNPVKVAARCRPAR
jgi:hypothetical protein